MRTKNKLLIALLLLAVVACGFFATRAIWVRSVGLLPSTAVVFSANASPVDKTMARVFHSIYGARCDVCDYTADETEINAAVDALPASGGLVKLSDGTFVVSANITLPSNVSLTGIGFSTILEMAAVTEFDLIINSDTTGGNTNIEVSHLTIDGSNTALDGSDIRAVIKLDSVTYSGVHHVQVIDPPRGAIMTCNATGCNISNNVLLSSATGHFRGAGIDFDNSSYCMIANNYIDGGDSCGGIAGAYGGGHNTITGNIVQNSLSAGVMVRGQHDTYNGNVFNNNATYGVLISGANCAYNQLASNIIYGNTVDGVRCIENSHDNSFIGNSIYDNTENGIYCYSSDNNTFQANSIYENGKHGIWVCNGSDDTRVVDNNVRQNSRTTNNTYHGIHVNHYGGTVCNRTLVAGNTIRMGASGNRQNRGLYIGTGNNNIAINNDLISSGIGSDLLIYPGIITADDVTHAWDCYVEHFQDVLAVTANYTRANEDLSAATPITFTIDAQPDIPRTLSGHFDSHAQITAYDITLTGFNSKGNMVTESFSESDGWDWETSHAYATVTSIEMTSRTGTGIGDTMDIGITDVIGLANGIYTWGGAYTCDIYKIKKNTANATVASAQVDRTYDTYDMSVIGLSGGDDFTIWYRSPRNVVE